MKYLRIMALLMAVVMCLGVGFAEEAADDEAELFNVGSGLDTEEIEEEIEEVLDGDADAGDDTDDDTAMYDAELISSLDVDVEEWMLSPELRAMLAVIMEFELYCNEDYDAETLYDTYGQPTIYVTVPAGLEGLGVGVMFFYTEAELVISATYLPILGQYTAFQSELSFDPAVAMTALDSEGLFSEYYEVTGDDYFNALSLMYDALSE